MPYPFVLPTTSSFSFSSCLVCESHPSLPLQASTHRGVVRDSLKRYKRLPPASQAPALSDVAAALQSYLPYLFAIDAGLSNKTIHSEEISVILQTAPLIEWRPTLSGSPLPGPLYQTTTAPVGTAERQTAISTATRHLLDAASIYTYLSARADCLPQQQGQTPAALPSPDLHPSTLRAQRALALAEATLLAVLKDDPYPAAVARARNPHDTEWMYKAPDLPRVRAHLFARLCLAAAEHAAQAQAAAGALGGRRGSGAGAGSGSGSAVAVADGFLRYLEDLRRASRARACRFFGIDAELGGQTGTAIAWLRAGLAELGVERKGDGGKGGGGLKGLRKEWNERREDKKVERGLDWGADGGRLEETRVIEMLEAKWTKQNDTMLTQPIPPIGPLLAQMPSGREIHTIPPFQPPQLSPEVLEEMRAPPDRSDEFGNYPSSDEETTVDPSPVGASSGRSADYRTGTPGYF
ncbi:d911976f-2399-4e21-b16a-f0602a608591 [Thermothielavioides terrestris]|uniref:pH-response regulator protein palC n=1 Tax=Thermothielavioides terrestris TaxID=2587410 RepID=A0A3S4AMA9_9PEZI|nr:d911976f-2399-4e21-b16a-f0602a608591 [Thermothielavioides terrestris]